MIYLTLTVIYLNILSTKFSQESTEPNKRKFRGSTFYVIFLFLPG